MEWISKKEKVKVFTDWYIGFVVGIGFRPKENGIIYLDIVLPFIYFDIAIAPKGYKFDLTTTKNINK